MPVTFFTSEAVTSNHYILFIPKTWNRALTVVLKYETATSLTYLVESTVLDTYQYELFNKDEDYELHLPRFLRANNYYSLSNRTRYTIFDSYTKNPLISCAFVYKNAVWLERELIEMYGSLVQTMHDTRNLLLEYSATETPMIKTYPTEGFVDIYYDFFRDQLCYVNHDYVEL